MAASGWTPSTGIFGGGHSGPTLTTWSGPTTTLTFTTTPSLPILDNQSNFLMFAGYGIYIGEEVGSLLKFHIVTFVDKQMYGLTRVFVDLELPHDAEERKRYVIRTLIVELMDREPAYKELVTRQLS